MKQIIFSLTALLFVVESFSQKPTLSKDYYLQKSKNQNTTGWVMLGGGVAMTLIGSIIADSDMKKTKTVSGYDGFFWQYSYTINGLPSEGALVLASVGILSAIGCIPFFISSSKNARKAATISFNNKNILMLQQNSFVSIAQPTITLKISL